MRDPETGEDYFNARMFGSAIGRFTSPDPGNAGADLMNPQSWNGYSYALGNPLRYTDPSGFDPVPVNCPDCTVTVYGGATPDIPTDPAYPGCISYGSQGCILLPVIPGGGSGSGGTPPPTKPSQPVQTKPSQQQPSKIGSCGPGVIGNFVSKYVGGNTIVSGNITTNAPTIDLGAALGSIFGPEGTLPGALIGSMFGVGGGISYVPGTGSLYAGPVATFGVGVGSGFSVSAVPVPSSQNANSIANGKSFSLTYQPNLFLGSTVTKSAGSGPPVVGPSIGSKVPVSASAGYSFCLRHCGC